MANSSITRRETLEWVSEDVAEKDLWKRRACDVRFNFHRSNINHSSKSRVTPLLRVRKSFRRNHLHFCYPRNFAD